MSESDEIYAVAAKVAKELPPDHDPAVAYSRESVMSPNIQHFPLRTAYLCGSCEAVSNHASICPACSSTGHQVLLSNLVEPVLPPPESSK